MKSKIWTVFILIIFINICVINCDNNADKERDNAITLAGIILAWTSSSLTQYTPNQANWDTFYTKATVGGTNKSHNPDGVGWLTASSWENAKWDRNLMPNLYPSAP